MSATLSPSELAERAEFAVDLARSVGRAAANFRAGADLKSLGVEDKGLQDFVTVADRKAEDDIRQALSTAFPDDGFMGEECGGVRRDGGMWVVDPIDGTTNFMRGFRHWGVSIAFVVDDNIEIGVVYDATRDKVAWAVRNKGSFSDDTPLRASQVTDPSRAIAILGHSRRTDFDAYLDTVKKLYELGIDYRRMGAAAIGLLRVADGTADLYYENHLNSWDMLAGILIAREAGAEIRMPSVSDILQNGGPVLAYARGLGSALSFLGDTIKQHPRLVRA